MANVREYVEIMERMKKGTFAPIYLLYGQEPYYIDKISRYIEQHAIEEHERDFNLQIFYGRDLNRDMLLEASRRFPMMAQRQVVVIREAQDFSGKWADLESFFMNPVDTTILVIDFKYKPVKSNMKWVKAIAKSGVVFKSDKHYDSDIPKVVMEFTKLMKYRISQHAAFLMAEYLGNDLEKIEGELHKLTITVPLSKEIDEQDVRKHIGVSKEYTAFDYVDALSARDAERSYRIAQYLGRNESNTPFVMIASSVFSQFTRIFMYHSLSDKSLGNMKSSIPGVGYSDYFARKLKDSAAQFSPRKSAEIISKLRELDARFKGVNSPSVDTTALLKELTYHVLN